MGGRIETFLFGIESWNETSNKKSYEAYVGTEGVLIIKLIHLDFSVGFMVFFWVEDLWFNYTNVTYFLQT